jgi:hypothetical protein
MPTFGKKRNMSLQLVLPIGQGLLMLWSGIQTKERT